MIFLKREIISELIIMNYEEYEFWLKSEMGKLENLMS